MSSTYGLVAVLLVVLGTMLVGGYGLRVSRTTSDFFVASRTVSPWWNASAIGGEYLSAASFVGIAGLVFAHGPDMVALLGGRDSSVHWDRLLFSAKESVYKSWFPLTRRWLGFEDAELVLGRDGTFTARVLVEHPVVDGRVVSGFTGRWLAREGFVVTAIAVPAR